METKKGSNVKIFFLVFVLVIMVAVVSYVYLYRPLAEKRDTLLKENHELNVRLIELQNLAIEKEDEYMAKIKESKNTIQKLLNNYSAGNTPEKSIMMVNTMENEVGIRLPNISFSQPNVVTAVTMPMVVDGEDGSYGITYYDVSLLQESLTMGYSCTYEQMKKLIDFINVYPERMNIESMTMAYDSETGGLKGNVSLNLFAVTGTGKEYVAPDISGLSLGESNIFEQ